MLEDFKACADFAFASLFDELDGTGPRRPAVQPRTTVQIALALIHAIPWILVFIFAIIVLLYFG